MKLLILLLLALLCLCTAQTTLSVAVYPAAFPFLNTNPNNTQNNVTGFSFEVFSNVVNTMNANYGYQLEPSFIYTNSSAEFNAVLRSVDLGLTGIATTPDQLALYGTTIPYRLSVIRAMTTAATTGADHPTIYNVWRVIKSPAVLQYLLLFLLFCIPAAHVQWLIEHRSNDDTYHKRYFTGIGASIYWTWITVTTVGYGDKVPKTMWGQIWTIIVLIIAVILVNLLAGSISANLTVSQLTQEPIDLLSLSQNNVSVIRDSYAAGLAQSIDANLIVVDSIEDGVAAVTNGTAAYFLHEQASMLFQNLTGGSIFFSGPTIADVQYSFLYPLNSTLPTTFYEDLNFAILTVKGSSNYTRLLQKYFSQGYISSGPKQASSLRDWIAIFVFLGIIVAYLVFLALGYIIFASRHPVPRAGNPTKEDVQPPSEIDEEGSGTQ